MRNGDDTLIVDFYNAMTDSNPTSLGDATAQ
jgi:hypothetical protein